jgi:hypothetical protein
MGMKLLRSAAAASALAGCLLVAGCGSSNSGSNSGSKPASDVLPAMQSAVKAATSVHMAGSVTSGGEKININLSFARANDLAGTFGVNGASFYVLTLSGKTYIKLDQSFLKYAKVPVSACSLICGKYVELPPSSASQITGSLSMSGIANQMFGKIPSSVTNSSAKFVPATFNGQQVLRFHGDGYSLDVAKSGTPYPVDISGPGGETITFTNWNSVTMPSAPPASLVISLSNL